MDGALGGRSFPEWVEALGGWSSGGWGTVWVELRVERSPGVARHSVEWIARWVELQVGGAHSGSDTGWVELRVGGAPCGWSSGWVGHWVEVELQVGGAPGEWSTQWVEHLWEEHSVGGVLGGWSSRCLRALGGWGSRWVGHHVGVAHPVSGPPGNSFGPHTLVLTVGTLLVQAPGLLWPAHSGLSPGVQGRRLRWEETPQALFFIHFCAFEAQLN